MNRLYDQENLKKVISDSSINLVSVEALQVMFSFAIRYVTRFFEKGPEERFRNMLIIPVRGTLGGAV